MTEKFIGIFTEVTGSHPVAAGLYSRVGRLLEANDYSVETVLVEGDSLLPKIDKIVPDVRMLIPDKTLEALHEDLPENLLMLRHTNLPGLQPHTIGLRGSRYLKEALAKYFPT